VELVSSDWSGQDAFEHAACDYEDLTAAELLMSIIGADRLQAVIWETSD
jgi:hypothetical protein